MGTTIRRQPLSFPIPASPDYKFLNITDFGGLNVSSNPFVVSSNTASDCLNVYVDEDNALSTRPRLQAKYDLMGLSGLNDEHEVVGVHNLNNGYLLHTRRKDGYSWNVIVFRETEEGLVKKIFTGSPLENPEKINVFEQNNNVYVMTGSGYYVIKDGVEFRSTVGYVPTTSIGKNKRVVTKTADGAEKIQYDLEGSEYESLNLLSNSYKETFFWDGASELQFGENVTDVNNSYYDKTVELLNLTAVKCYEDNTGVYVKNDELVYFTLSSDLKEIYEYPLNISLSSVNLNGGWYSTTCKFAPSRRNKKFVVKTPYTTSDGKVHRKLTVYKIVEENNSATVIGVIDDAETSGELHISENAKYVWCGYAGYYKLMGENVYERFEMSEPSDEGFVPRTLRISEYGDVGYYATEYIDNSIALERSKVYEIKNFDKSQTKRLVVDEKNTHLAINLMLLPNGLGFRTGNDVYLESTNYTPIALNVPRKDYSTLHFSEDGDYGWFLHRVDSTLHVIPNIKKINTHYSTYVHLDEDPLLYKPGGVLITGTWDNWFGEEDELYSSVVVRPFSKSTEPLITTTNTLSDVDERKQQWDELREIFKKSQLFERFDNNTWFASKNYTFHTQYNDPTYIPLSSYNDLGEDFEDITGLSIVNDNVLAAYKSNRIYIITPITVGDKLTYSYTETKNVIGNSVPDAPILTTLTEMPTIVSYDGIFALNQLENVQSGDRITTLISENINPRWLKESKSDINCCKTINRLYWTYYILPHHKTSDEKNDYTKVYLLDNRTQQWYYWELPIHVVGAMVKDGKTHLVHEDGTVYTLETTDLIHEYNQDVTEYYDGVGGEKLIIPWNWTSQILSLNTINYSKKLVDTTFVLTDTDTQDEYGLDYSFKAWRKSVSETNATTISNNIHYVQSTTKRTMIPRFNFIQIRLSNTSEDLDNNKLRLVGLGLKYVLLEGLY